MHEIRKYQFLEIRIAAYHPIRPKGYLKLPKEMSAKYFINVKCQDSFCFVYSILAALRLHEIRLPNLPNLLFEEATKAQKQRF